MLTLKYFLFFALISFTLQFDHCHTAAKICQNMIPTNTGSIVNVLAIILKIKLVNNVNRVMQLLMKEIVVFNFHYA